MDIKKAWLEYKKSGDRQVKNILINNYIPLVQITAGRLKSTITSGSVEMDDLISYGVLGLLDAIDKFDLEKNVKFETYAQMRIRGSMIDQLRKNDWAPRSMRQKAKQIENAYRELENKFGRNPTDEEVAELIGIETDEFLELLGQVSTLSMVSLEEMLENKMEARVGAISREGEDFRISEPERLAQAKEMKRILKQAIDELPEREKLIITLYYFEELTYKEIGIILSVSESRVSQLHTKAVMRMRNSLSEHRRDLSI
jgi:RNA polymerase sigma factor for flagellar operon FliA